MEGQQAQPDLFANSIKGNDDEPPASSMLLDIREPLQDATVRAGVTTERYSRLALTS